MNNVRVKFNGKFGTVIGNPYRHYNKGVWDKYTEVLFDDNKNIVSVETDKLEVL